MYRRPPPPAFARTVPTRSLSRPRRVDCIASSFPPWLKRAELRVSWTRVYFAGELEGLGDGG